MGPSTLAAVVAVTVSLALLVAPGAGYGHNDDELLGRQSHPDPGSQFQTVHGHMADRQQYHECFDDAVRICAPHHDADDHNHHTLTKAVSISRMYRCMVNHRMLFPKECRGWVTTHEGCVGDIEKLCPGKPLAPTIDCMEERHREVSPTCKDSPWYHQQFPLDAVRVSPMRHHTHDDDPPLDHALDVDDYEDDSHEWHDTL